MPQRDYDWQGLRARASHARAHLRSAVSSRRAGGERVVGVGATARASTIIGYCGLSREDLDCVYEVPGSGKIEHYMPGTLIPVWNENNLFFEPHQPDAALLFSWHLKDRIVPKLRERGYAGDIIVPLPELENLRLPLSDVRRVS